MKQLVDITATVSSLTCRAEKSGKQWADEKAATLTVIAHCDGKAAAQFFPTSTLWQGLADAVFEDDGAIKLRVGTFPLEYEIQGGVVTIQCPLWDKPLEFEGADVRSLSITPCEGRMCEIRFSINLKPQDPDWEQLVRMLKREIVICARMAPGGEERAEQAGQTTMPLPQASDSKVEGETDVLFADAVAFIARERLCASSLLQSHLKIDPDRTRRILEQLEGACIVSAPDADGVRDILVDEDFQLPVNDAHPEETEEEPIVPGQKPPQRPKRTSARASVQ